MKRFIVFLLKCYKAAVSPFMPPACIHVPTCSQYAMEAVERHGAMAGGWLSARRLLRCTPLHKGGVDPVP